MARGRMISNTLGSSRRFAQLGQHKKLGEFAQALYPLMVSHADDFGRLPGDAFTIKHRIFPTSPRPEVAFAGAIAAMTDAGLVACYTADGLDVIEIVQFSAHQAGLHKRTKSRFPDPAPRAAVPSPPEALGSDRVARFLELYPELYLEVVGQPYLASRLQMERDLEAAQMLVSTYEEADLDQLVRLYLSVDESHPKARLLRGSQRTLPKLVTMAGSLAEALEVRGGETG